MHLQGLQKVALDLLTKQLLCLRACKCDVALREEGCDVALCDLPLPVHSVLELTQLLGCEPQLGLFHRRE